MQSVVIRDKLSALVLLAASISFGVLAGKVGAPGAGTESARLLLAAALAGGVIAVLMLLSPGKSGRSLASTVKADWPRLSILALLVAGYGLVLQTLGFFFATSLFLAIGYFLLGERRFGPLFIASVPVAALLEILMRGVFGIDIVDPAFGILGIVT